MPTRPVESIHEAEPEHPVEERPAADAVDSPSASKADLPRETNADDLDSSDQDIDTAGTAADDLSPTKSL
jgi:hypothetical protein